eukprot:8508506-Heterocapsa_arctica.AAC.1
MAHIACACALGRARALRRWTAIVDKRWATIVIDELWAAIVVDKLWAAIDVDTRWAAIVLISRHIRDIPATGKGGEGFWEGNPVLLAFDAGIIFD